MDTKTVIARAIEVVTFILAAFNFFLPSVAPPEQAAQSFAVGLGSLIALCVLLFFTALAKDLPAKKYRTRWLAFAAVGIVATTAAGIYYYSIYEEYTFVYPPGASDAPRYIAGDEFTPEASRYSRESGVTGPADLLYDYGGLPARHEVWSPESLLRTKRLLATTYIALLLLFSATIFSLTEGVLVSRSTKRRGQPQPT